MKAQDDPQVGKDVLDVTRFARTGHRSIGALHVKVVQEVYLEGVKWTVEFR